MPVSGLALRIGVKPLRHDQVQLVLRLRHGHIQQPPFFSDLFWVPVKVAGRFRTSGAMGANEAAVQGLGIATAPLWQVRSLVDRGAVELILTRFEPPPVPIHGSGGRRGYCRPERNCLSNFWPSVFRRSSSDQFR